MIEKLNNDTVFENKSTGKPINFVTL